MLGGELLGVRAIGQDALHCAGCGLAVAARGGSSQEVGHAGGYRADAPLRRAGSGLAHRVRELLVAEVELVEQAGKNSHGVSVMH